MSMTEWSPDEIWEHCTEGAAEVVYAFSELYPDVKMNFRQWSDLREMIEREFRGRLDGSDISANELCRCYKEMRQSEGKEDDNAG